MIKIKTRLFEGIIACTIFPNIGFIFTTLLLIISLINQQKIIVYQGIIISYFVCLIILIVSILICLIINKKSTNEMVITKEKIIFKNNIYQISQIESCNYYLCKWYCIPIAYAYKQQLGGLLSINFLNGEKIKIKIFYSWYKKIRKIIDCNVK